MRACLVALLLLSGCSTVAPRGVESKGASYDGNAKNSGFLGFDAQGNGIISAADRGRYNDLIAVYGRDARLTRDQGLAPRVDGTWSITRECLVKFLQMSDWKRASLQPLIP